MVKAPAHQVSRPTGRACDKQRIGQLKRFLAAAAALLFICGLVAVAPAMSPHPQAPPTVHVTDFNGVGMDIPAPPPLVKHGLAEAAAADNAWSQSTCDWRVYVYGVPGQGAWYWNIYQPDLYIPIGGEWFQVYAATGYECGWLGMPTGAGQLVYQGRGGTEYAQQFAYGCILARNFGHSTPYVYQGYWYDPVPNVTCSPQGFWTLPDWAV